MNRVKSRSRSRMNNDMLNALLHISINGPPANTKEADELISRVVDIYVKQKLYKVPHLHSMQENPSTHEESIDDLEGSIDDIDIGIRENDEDFVITNFEHENDSENEHDSDN